MAYSVVWTPDAERDLDMALSYLAVSLGQPTAASRLADGMESLVGTFGEFPLAHEMARDQGLAQRGYRKALVGSYVVLYLVDTALREVAITNVFHGSQDYARLV